MEIKDNLCTLNTAEFLKLQREKRKIVELYSKLANRSVNEGFSGGEKKRKEVLQKLPMEFAVEAQKLLSVSLEGTVG